MPTKMNHISKSVILAAAVLLFSFGCGDGSGASGAKSSSSPSQGESKNRELVQENNRLKGQVTKLERERDGLNGQIEKLTRERDSARKEKRSATIAAIMYTALVIGIGVIIGLIWMIKKKPAWLAFITPRTMSSSPDVNYTSSLLSDKKTGESKDSSSGENDSHVNLTPQTKSDEPKSSRSEESDSYF